MKNGQNDELKDVHAVQQPDINKPANLLTNQALQKRKIKVGISGLGAHGFMHLLALSKIPDVEIVGAFDPDLSRFSFASKEYGYNLRFFNSYQDMLFHCDAVVICAPKDVIFSQLYIASKEYNKHVLCEIPKLSSQEEKEMVRDIVMNTTKVIAPCYLDFGRHLKDERMVIDIITKKFIDVICDRSLPFYLEELVVRILHGEI